jgi:hypothetical protein
MSEASHHNALLTLRDEIRNIMNDYTDAMATGDCESYAAYRFQCGVIHGLALAERSLLDLNQRIEEA